jgi:hypothetical protein
LKSLDLVPSERIKQALTDYRQDSDVIGAFLSEMVAPTSSRISETCVTSVVLAVKLIIARSLFCYEEME